MSRHKITKLQSPKKLSKFYVHIGPVFSCRSHTEYSLLEHKMNRKVLIAHSSKSVLAIKTFESQQYIQYSQCDALVKGQQCIEEFL